MPINLQWLQSDSKENLAAANLELARDVVTVAYGLLKLIAPKLPTGLPVEPKTLKDVGTEKFARLKALNMSAESVRFWPSRMGIDFRRLKSVLIVLGPVKMSGPTFPM